MFLKIEIFVYVQITFAQNFEIRREHFHEKTVEFISVILAKSPETHFVDSRNYVRRCVE